jgi:hypothetical protein
LFWSWRQTKGVQLASVFLEEHHLARQTLQFCGSHPCSVISH